MSKKSEAAQVSQHYIDFITHAARLNYDRAKGLLQIAQHPVDRFALADDMELWDAVLTLLDQRDKLLKYVLLLLRDRQDATVNACEIYLKEKLGVMPEGGTNGQKQKTPTSD